MKSQQSNPGTIPLFLFLTPTGEEQDEWDGTSGNDCRGPSGPTGGDAA